jgi:hypothetical protein
MEEGGDGQLLAFEFILLFFDDAFLNVKDAYSLSYNYLLVVNCKVFGINWAWRYQVNVVAENVPE